MTEYNIASPQEFAAAPAAVVIDVRTGPEHDECHLSGAHLHIPLDEISAEKLVQKGVRTDQAIYVLCRSGGRARIAAEKFVKLGYANVTVIEGGITACEASGHSVNRTAKCGKIISIDRQMRIVAGGLSALGALLALVVSPYFAFIPLGIGLGLLNAGITDCCPMITLLTQMPWNKKKTCQSCN